jgi:acetolactate synthase-1/2/3 large subunit
MRETGGRAVVRALEDEGIPFTFGIPGTHNIELYDALAESKRVKPILVTDEQSASFMADAVWRSSGKLGCVNLVPGAGLTHAMSGIAEAYMDNAAMLVLGCGIRRDTGHVFQLHDIDQIALVKPVTKAQFLVESGEELYATVRRACAIARGGAPGPVFVEVPANLYFVPHSTDRPDATRWVPVAPPDLDLAAVEQAADILRQTKRPLLYLGAGAAGAGTQELVRLAETLQSPVSTTFQGKGVFPESHPLWLWPGFGQAAPPFARKLAATCDVTLAIGCRFSEVGTGSYGIEPPGPLIHVDIERFVLNANFPAEVAIASDAGEFVKALLERLEPKSRDSALHGEIAGGRAGVERDGRDDPAVGQRVSPSLLLRALQQRFGQEAIFTADSGNGTFLAVECLRLERPGRFLAPVDYSCMGYSVPAALGAALANPDLTAVALAGDGAFLMTGLELLTAAHHGLPVLILVLRDRELAQIAQFQDVALNRKVGSRLPDYDVGQLCGAMGVECLNLESNGKIEDVLASAAAALAERRPVAVDVAIDYSRKTHFTRGVVQTNFRRLPWRERLRMVSRALARKVTG